MIQRALVVTRPRVFADRTSVLAVRLRAPGDMLTERERQIILVLSDGITNKEIGRRLGLTEGTVKVHLHRIYRKLGIANRTALAVLAYTGTG